MSTILDNKVIGISELQEYDKQRQAHLATELKELDDATVCTFNIAGANTTITLQGLTGMTEINWGDGTIDSALSHTYNQTGEYTCVIEGVTSIGDSAFSYCSSLTSVDIPDSVTSIGEWAFYNCGRLTSVTIGNSVTSIGSKAFSACYSLTSVTIGDSVTSIGSSAFSSCSSLTSVVIPDSVTSIGDSAFSYCSSLTSVDIPDSVTSVNGYAFYNCGRLTSVTIGNSVTSIGEKAFSGCSSLKQIEVKAIAPPSIQNNTLSDSLQKIIVPLESLEAYKTASNWSTYADRIVAIADTNWVTANAGGSSSTSIEINIWGDSD